MLERPTMIHQTRKELTAWFVLGVMFISILMSCLLFWVVDRQLRNDYRRVQQRLNMAEQTLKNEDIDSSWGEKTETQTSLLEYGINRSSFFLAEIVEFRINFINRLIQFNLVVLILSALTGYWWAGLSLQPLEQAFERERRFSSDVSHELKTPLSALKTSMEVSLSDQTLSKKMRELIIDNLHDVNHLEVIVQQLQALARAEKAKAEGTSSLPKVLKKLKKIHSKAANDKNVNLIFPEKPPKRRLVGSQSQLVELLSILVDNAIKFVPKGGKVEIKIRGRRKRVEVCVIDNGPGIEPQSLPHIFERFVKGSRSRTRTGQSGLGLGLSIAKQIVEQLGGDISVKTTPQKGSQFTVSLPS